ncbi:MAG: 50S ribosomal protein L29 [Saprospiraceae bacterium]
MASKKYLELQEFSDGDLISELQTMEKDFQKQKFDHTIKGLDNPILLREMGRDIARFKTEARRRELAKMSAEELENRSKIRARRKK